MAADLRGLVEQLVHDQGFQRLVNNPLAQFGLETRRYLGAELLPEENKPENIYVEEAIRYRTLIANHGTRYSPVQIKGGTMVGSFNVKLSHSDIGSPFTSQDYDAFIRALERFTGQQGVEGGGINRPDMSAVASLTKWVDMTLHRPLLELNEKNRWEAIVAAQVVCTGDDGYIETVKYPNPTGHRVAVGGQWSDDNYDPWMDITAGAEFLSTKGYTVSRIICSTPVRTKLALNRQMRLRAGHLSVNVGFGGGSTVQNVAKGRVQLEALNELARQDGLPPFTLYDLRYNLTPTVNARFLPNNVLVMVCETGRDHSIDLGDLQPLVPPDTAHTIGYTGIGRAAGQATPGRVVVMEARANKPPRIDGEGWQVSLPVITEPEALFVLTGIS